jgi:hypothetical protein
MCNVFNLLNSCSENALPLPDVFDLKCSVTCREQYYIQLFFINQRRCQRRTWVLLPTKSVARFCTSTQHGRWRNWRHCAYKIRGLCILADIALGKYKHFFGMRSVGPVMWKMKHYKDSTRKGTSYVQYNEERLTGLRTNCLLKHVTEGKVEETGRR